MSLILLIVTVEIYHPLPDASMVGGLAEDGVRCFCPLSLTPGLVGL